MVDRKLIDAKPTSGKIATHVAQSFVTAYSGIQEEVHAILNNIG